MTDKAPHTSKPRPWRAPTIPFEQQSEQWRKEHPPKKRRKHGQENN